MIAVIPARGGSKRIPRKNIREFCGQPMISWSIEAAQETGLFDQVIVSTDDQQIASIARSYGADAPFVRPENLADDFATTNEVVKHAICELGLSENDLVCCIYATAVFLRPEDIQAGYEQMKADKSLEFVFSATSFPFPIQRAFHLSEGGGVSMLQPEHLKTRSQDLEEAYHDAGQFYWGKASAFTEDNAIFAEHSRALILPRYRVQDIDTEEDWVRAELMFKGLKEKN